MKKLIDLHAHTTASDGALSPTELVEEAARVGLAAVAVSDHDTVEGVAEALEAGKRLGVEVVPGVEFSIKHNTGGHFHLLGLLIDHTDPVLIAALDRVARSRADRNRIIVDKLNKLGMDLTLEEVLAISTRGNTGRPHIGQALVDRGYVADITEAMEKYIGNGRPAYESRYRPLPEEAIQFVHQAGGLAVLAHPVSTTLEGPKLKARLAYLQEHGLDGVEVFCPSQDEVFRLEVRAMAESLGLLITGGSDFHGRYKPDIALGFGRGDLRNGYELLERLKERKGEAAER